MVKEKKNDSLFFLGRGLNKSELKTHDFKEVCNLITASHL